MIVPDVEDLSTPSKYADQWEGRLSQLFDRPSPVLPLHFDKKYLPHNLCEKQYTNLFECVVFHSNDSAGTCSYFISKFENCRRSRDTAIMENIKLWQIKHIREMDLANRKMYLQGLKFKIQRLKNDYARTPSISSKQLQLSQLESEMEQLRWRMKYIEGILNQ